MVYMKETRYDLVEYENENEFIIGSILYYKGKVCHAKIHEDEIGSFEDIKKVEEFLEIAKSKEWIRQNIFEGLSQKVDKLDNSKK